MSNWRFARAFQEASAFCLGMARAHGTKLAAKQPGRPASQNDHRPTIAGNGINDLYGWEEGAIARNTRNNRFG